MSVADSVSVACGRGDVAEGYDNTNPQAIVALNNVRTTARIAGKFEVYEQTKGAHRVKCAPFTPLLRYRDVVGPGPWRRFWKPVFREPGKMHFQGYGQTSPCLLRSRSSCYTTRNIGDTRGETLPRLLYHHKVLHSQLLPLNLACLRMLFSVPGASSSLSAPAIVTRPGLTGCLNCL